MNETIPTETPNMNKWLEDEQQEIQQSNDDVEKYPALILEENKITEFEVDFSKPFEKYTSPEGVVKRIVPVLHDGEKKIFWLNIKNPCYREIIQRGIKGQKKFRVFRTGQKQATRYNVVD